MSLFIRFIQCVVILIYCLFPAVKVQFTPKPAYEASYENLGIPLSDYYPNGIPARSAWDVEFYDGKLFVAGGDYDANSGPVPIYCYDFTENTWKYTGTVPDEQVEHFKIIQGKLMTPGCDPKAGWDLGNIYVYGDNRWTTVRNIPGGIHQFDLIEFDGNIFVGLGTVPGQFPIAVSKDNGTAFSQLMMYKNGIPLDTSVPDDAQSVQIRVYDFFTLNKQLYAYYFRYVDKVRTHEIYRYDNDAFHYYCDLPENISTNRINYRIFDEKAEYDGQLYFTTGNLYVTSDWKSVEKIKFPAGCIVTDIRVIDNSLYAVTSQKQPDGTYRTALWCKEQNKTDEFREILYFSFPCPAQSFTYANGTIYFGMGDGTLSNSNSANGTILAIYVMG